MLFTCVSVGFDCAVLVWLLICMFGELCVSWLVVLFEVFVRLLFVLLACLGLSLEFVLFVCCFQFVLIVACLGVVFVDSLRCQFDAVLFCWRLGVVCVVIICCLGLLSNCFGVLFKLYLLCLLFCCLALVFDVLLL